MHRRQNIKLDVLTESPAFVSTLTMTMSFRLTEFCTEEIALAVEEAMSTQVHQMENYTTGVCADLTCSNAVVKAWCQSSTPFIVHTEIHFENMA